MDIIIIILSIIAGGTYGSIHSAKAVDTISWNENRTFFKFYIAVLKKIWWKIICFVIIWGIFVFLLQLLLDTIN